MAVDTTAIVTGAPSRNAPKTIEGQWQAVKPPWEDSRTQSPTTSVPQRISTTSLMPLNMLHQLHLSLYTTIGTATKSDTTLLKQQSATILYLLLQRPTTHKTHSVTATSHITTILLTQQSLQPYIPISPARYYVNIPHRSNQLIRYSNLLHCHIS